MPTSKRKPAAKNPVELPTVVQTATPEPEMPTEAQVQIMTEEAFAPTEPMVLSEQELAVDLHRLLEQFAPQPPEAATALAQMVRDTASTRDVLFVPEPGVVLMFGYGGLVRVLPAHRHVHIATVDELAAMSDQQVYDAVKDAK